MDLTDLRDFLVLFAFIAFIGAAASLALSEFKSDIEGDLSSAAVTFEQHTWPASTVNFSLTHDLVSSGSDVGWAVYNTTQDNRTLTRDVDYEVISYARGRIGVINASYAGNATYWNYTHSLEDVAYNITVAGEDGVLNATGFLDTIGTIAGVAVLIGIVILAFTFVRK